MEQRVRALEALLHEHKIPLPADIPAKTAPSLQDQSAAPPPVAPGGDWREFMDDQRKYYYNPETGQPQWEPPPTGTQERATMQSDSAVKRATPDQAALQDLLQQLKQRRNELAHAQSLIPSELTQTLEEHQKRTEELTASIMEFKETLEERKKTVLGGILQLESAQVQALERSARVAGARKVEVAALIPVYEEFLQQPIWDLIQNHQEIEERGTKTILSNSEPLACEPMRWESALDSEMFKSEVVCPLECREHVDPSAVSVPTSMTQEELRQTKEQLDRAKLALLAKGNFLQAAPLLARLEKINVQLRAHNQCEETLKIVTPEDDERKKAENESFFSQLRCMF